MNALWVRRSSKAAVKGRVPKELGPVRKAKIRRNDDRSSLVAFRHDMEKQFSTFFIGCE
ncbi:hypothetical protein DMR_18420 [Solidesulfovibrio magneticus RS-1]|uniref:Uncharacterized protein n=1 Tax=Solidesulfovibrio magneticus (strain ATCC 700980 / DSM 13731 / RS-1) TaxID=573370 RepID=C4XQG8_SOLM1|nr:hypothetical protein DMR_18420 [Solidesulfovibrio magneticus RS-1]